MYVLFVSRKPFILLLLILFSLVTFGCSGESEPPATPEDAVYKIFGEAKDDKTGIADVAFSPKEETLPARMGIVYH